MIAFLATQLTALPCGMDVKRSELAADMHSLHIGAAVPGLAGALRTIEEAGSRRTFRQRVTRLLYRPIVLQAPPAEQRIAALELLSSGAAAASR